MTTENVLFALLRGVVCGTKEEESVKNACTPEMLERVYELAQKHDLAHLVGHAIAKWQLPQSQTLDKCKQYAVFAVYRQVQISYAFANLCDALAEAKILHIPLKGAVLRDLYPQPWMRTSCDIDMLVREEDLEAAANVLVEKLHYKRGGKGDHDLSMYTADGLHVELHYAAVDEGRFPEAQKILQRIWEHASPREDGAYRLWLSDAMFYFYHIAHMAKHFENGGCGIRPFMDLWILRHCMDYDPQARDALLTQGNMLKFARAAEALSDAWFANKPKDAAGELFERFILTGGAYGNQAGLVTVRQTQQGSKLRYAVGKIFLPYSTMKHYYPVLQKKKWLLPLYQVVRWCKLLFKGGVKRSVRELKTNAAITSQETAATVDLLKHLGL